MSDLVEDLRRLIAFDTVSHKPVTELASFLAQRLEDLGFTVEWHTHNAGCGKANLIARAGPIASNPTQGLTISGHMDVVPTENQPWTSDPFSLTERDGRLYGRGTADMKGFFACTLAALERLDLSKLSHPLVLIWTHDEEVGCLGSAHLVGQLEGKNAVFPQACLIGEPTDFQVLRMHPGHVALEVAVTGKAAHSSQPWLGRNAITQMGHLMDKLQSIHKQYETKQNLQVPFNIAQIQGGSAVNIVPDRCTVTVGYRPPPGLAPEELFRLLQEPLETKDAVFSLLRVTPSLLTQENTPLEQLLVASASTEEVGSATFATDGGNLSKLGCKPLIFGPGSISVAHRADEWVESAALFQATDIIESVIRTRCFD